MENKKSSDLKVDILIIDNYDSFTYNLVQCLGILGENIKVRRNDRITISEIEEMSPQKIVISPGPGRPESAGISMDLIRCFYKKIPILGVCLGHQCIGQVFGGKIVNSGIVLHGKTSQVFHDEKGVFNGIKNPFTAARYHSLIISKNTLSDDFNISAWTEDEVIIVHWHFGREKQFAGIAHLAKLLP